MGLEVTDLFILIAAWMFNLQVLGDFVHPRAKFLFAGVVTFIILKIWQSVKDKVPDQFGSHIMDWITETEVYSVAPDAEQHPLIVNYAQLKAETSPHPTPKPAPAEPTS
jgi:hypothetical protein